MTGNIEDTVHLPKTLIENAVYKAILVTSGTDPETGYVDDWWWELKEVQK